MRERDVERYLKTKIESLGGLCLKFESPGYSGVPDRLCLLPKGKLFFVEVKRPGETLRKLQEKRRKDFQALGHQVYVVDSKESINQLIQANGE
ncbi:VRR-NUC domain-containing protein [Piscibacillus sp. B03]|uniref:VRR-NUC domain-containing protein n=1 Tax=Piscibacillus sp. B03 TaxID=3457430 RepID=UPI003FCDD0EE